MPKAWYRVLRMLNNFSSLSPPFLPIYEFIQGPSYLLGEKIGNL